MDDMGEFVPSNYEFLDAKRREIRARLEELRPAHDEYIVLQQAELVLAGNTAAPVLPHRGPGRPPGSKNRGK